MNRSKRKIQIERWASCGYMVVFSLALQALMIQSAVGQSDDDKKLDKPKLELLECEVRVTDPDGNPVENATISRVSIASSTQSWDAGLLGPVRRAQTNSDGIAKLPFPEVFRNKLEIISLDCIVDHPDFVLSFNQCDVKDAPAEIRLERGFRIALSAKNSITGQPVKEDLYAVTNSTGLGFARQADWNLKKNGMLVSGVYPKQKCFLRVMQFAEGQPTLFSDMITIEPGKQSRILLRDIELSVGSRLEGKLDPSVKRPVKNGRVVGCVDRLLEPGDPRTNWGWSDSATIKADGSFVFESLPRDVVWEMIAVCDEWVPDQPRPESIKRYFPKIVTHLTAEASRRRLPQFVMLSGDEVSATLRMIPAASVTATFVGPDGKPITGVKTVMWPMQYWTGRGARLLGWVAPSRDFVAATSRGEKDQRSAEMKKDDRFHSKSDASGICKIKNLPPGKSKLYVFHDKFQLPNVNGKSKFEFELKQGEQKALTINLQVKEESPKFGEGVVDE